MTGDQRPGLRRAVGALRHRNFQLFYAALLVSAIGGQLQTFANIWLIYQLTESPLHLGLTGLARAIPIITLSLVGGVVADRVDRRQFVLVTQGMAGLLAIALAILAAAGAIEVWHIYLFTFLGSMLMALSAPARTSMIPNLVPREDLLNAIALNSTVWQAASIIGPMLAGLSVAAFGFAPTYAANALAHAVTVAALALMQTGPLESRPGQSALKGFLEGFAFVRDRSIILVLLATDSAATFFGSYQILLPFFAGSLGVGAAGLGVLLAAPGVGSLAGAALVMFLGDVRYKGLVVVGGILAYCGALVLLALSPIFLLSVVAAFLLGVFDSLQATPRNGVIQLVTPDHLRGRASSFQHMLTNGMPSLGQVQSGAVAALVGAPLALVLGAAACAAVVLGLTAARSDLRAAELGAVPPVRQPGLAPRTTAAS